MEKYRFKRHLWTVIAGMILALFLIVVAELQGILSPRGLGFSALFVLVAGTVALIVIARKHTKDAQATGAHTLRAGPIMDAKERKRITRSIWMFKVCVAFLALSLVAALWRQVPAFIHGQYDGLFPALVGVVMNLTFTATFVWAIRQSQKKLR